MLSRIDRKILKTLLSRKGKASLHVAASSSSSSSLNRIIANKLGLPLSVVKSRRNRLEKNFLELFYVMNLESFGYRRVDFLISTQNGTSPTIANELLKVKEVVSVGRSIGQPTIDLRAELIVKDNGQLLELLEQVKAMNGVRDVVWSEIIKVVGNKGSVPPRIIDIL